MDGSNAETIKTGLYYVIGIDIGRNPSNAGIGPGDTDVLFYADNLGGPDCESGDLDGYKGQVGYVALDGSTSGALIEGCNDKNAYMDDPIAVAYVPIASSLPEEKTPGIMYTEYGTDGSEPAQGVWYRCLTASALVAPTSLWLDNGSKPTSVSYDKTTNKVYWTTQGAYPFADGKIWRGTLDLENNTIDSPELLVHGIEYITAFNIDMVNQAMYWSEGPFALSPGTPPWYYTCGLEDKTIWYAPMSGTGSVPAAPFMGSLNMPIGTFISTTRRLYWSDGCDGTVKSAPLTGSGYYDTSSFSPNRI